MDKVDRYQQINFTLVPGDTNLIFLYFELGSTGFGASVFGYTFNLSRPASNACLCPCFLYSCGLVCATLPTPPCSSLSFDSYVTSPSPWNFAGWNYKGIKLILKCCFFYIFLPCQLSRWGSSSVVRRWCWARCSSRQSRPTTAWLSWGSSDWSSSLM